MQSPAHFPDAPDTQHLGIPMTACLRISTPGWDLSLVPEGVGRSLSHKISGAKDVDAEQFSSIVLQPAVRGLQRTQLLRSESKSPSRECRALAPPYGPSFPS